MERNQLNDLAAFQIVADEGSFTRARSETGHVVTGFEPCHERASSGGSACASWPGRHAASRRRGCRPAPAADAAAGLADIEAGLASLSELRDTPSGSLRISVPKPAAGFVMTALAQFPPAYPDIPAVEVVSDDELHRHRRRPVRRRRAAGRKHRHLQDMIAVRISPEITVRHGGGRISPPTLSLSAREAGDPLRAPGRPSLCSITIGRSGHAPEGSRPGVVEARGAGNCPVRVRGQASSISANDRLQKPRALDAASEGPPGSLAILSRLVSVARTLSPFRSTGAGLEDWCPPFPGFYLYYPSRRHSPPALPAAPHPCAALEGLAPSMAGRGLRHIERHSLKIYF